MLIRYLKCMAALALVASTTAVALVGAPARAQSQATDSVPVTHTVGILDTDGSALYSVLFESATDALGNLTVTSAVPANTTFVEAVSAPDGATVTVAPDKKSVSWQFANLDANTILGPFTFRAKAADPSVALPAGTSAQVSWTTPDAGSVNAAAADGTLQPLDTSGQITVDAKGTVDAQGQPMMVPVGKTGVTVYVPAGAVTQSVMLTFTNTTFVSTGVPALDDKYWWCEAFDVTSTPSVTLAQPLQVIVPTRQVLTPGLPIQAIEQTTNGSWQLANIPGSTILPDGNHLLFEISGTLSASPSANLPVVGRGGTHMMAVSTTFTKPNWGLEVHLRSPWGVTKNARALSLLCQDSCPEVHHSPRGVTKNARALGQVKAPAVSTTNTSSTTPQPGHLSKFLDVPPAIFHTCYLVNHSDGSTWTHCTVYVGGVYSGYIEYPGSVNFS